MVKSRFVSTISTWIWPL